MSAQADSPGSDKPTVICIAGPTAVGKTDLAVQLVESLAGEIKLGVISVDSALVYRGMDIGTAKPDPATLARVPHKLIDIRDPWETYSAGDFCTDVVNDIQAMNAAGVTPLLAGGTMMYFHALQTGLAVLPEADATVRASIDAEAEKSGWSAMHGQLQSCDPVSAARIQPTDAQRIQRALEVYRLTGEPISELQKETRPPVDANFVNIGLIPEDRAALHRRIEQRFDSMLANGFQAEVEGLLALPEMSPGAVSMRAVGYRQMIQYLEGAWSRDAMREKGIVATRRLAKRQMTWLRSMNGLHTLQAEASGRLEMSQSIIKDALRTG